MSRRFTYVIGALLVAAAIISLNLAPLAIHVSHAITENDRILTFRKIAVLAIHGDRNRFTLVNLTNVNMTINISELAENLTSSGACNTTPSPDFNITVELLANLSSSKGIYNLTLYNVTISNGTSTLKALVLVYTVHRKNYNLSLTTKILINTSTAKYYAFLTTVNIQPLEKKAEPIMDAIVVLNATKLSTYYKLLAATLQKYLADGESRWLWNQVSKELRHLARLVEAKLNEYDKSAKGLAVVADFDAWCCIASIGSVIECLLANSYLLSICPLCAQVITCIPACASIFSIWWCLGCIGAGLAGCAACLIYAAACSYAAYSILQCCF